MAKHRYSVHPVVPYARTIVANLAEKTGRSLEGWVALLRERGPAEEKAQIAWLKQQYKLGGTRAQLIVSAAAGRGAVDTDPDAYLAAASGYVAAMYDGRKAGLLPLYGRLLELGLALGADVRACPCKTFVPLYRRRVFAQIKPTTQKRIDLGLALAGHQAPLPPRLIETGGMAKGDRISHRIAITCTADIDDEARSMLQLAYDLDL